MEFRFDEETNNKEPAEWDTTEHLMLKWWQGGKTIYEKAKINIDEGQDKDKLPKTFRSKGITFKNT